MPHILTPNLPIDIDVELVHPSAKLPTRATTGASGFDVVSVEDSTELKPGEFKLFKTGLKMSIPEDYEIQVRPRSGLALKHGITVLNSPGTIDSDYRGEIGVILINHSNVSYFVQHGERIAQLVVAWNEAPDVVFQHVDSIASHETERGAGGFGSTGS